MNRSAATRAAALGILLSSAVASTPSLAQRPRGRTTHRPAAAAACVQFTQQTSDDGRSITFELANHCTTPVQGTVRWSVVCGSASEGTPEEHDEPVQPNQSRVLVATAGACGAGPWRIDGVRWSWRPQPAPTE